MNACLGCSSSAETCWIVKCESTWLHTSFNLKDEVVSESGWRLGFSSRMVKVYVSVSRSLCPFTKKFRHYEHSAFYSLSSGSVKV